MSDSEESSRYSDEDLWDGQNDDAVDSEDTTPRGNIRSDLEGIFGNDANFGGDFSYHQEFKDAPNPVLKLTKLGVIGLPLSAREAAAIKKECKQAPFGKGERTVVDKKVRDTWEMDASKVKFENPAWNKFMDDVVQETCKALGVDFASSKPRCELYKLLLYEKGSHFLPHVDTEKANGMFATIVVVLPSAFTGGAVHLTHHNKSVKYDCAKASKMNTSVLAWYTDIKHEVKPIGSGYRLALSYNLVHTTSTIRPAVQMDAVLTASLDRVFRAWKADTDGKHSPTKIVYRLDHSYSQANLNGSALKGMDADRVAVLLPVAKKHGFRLALAHATLWLCGLYDEQRGGFEPRSIGPGSASVEHVVDLDGELICKTLGVRLGAETIPCDITRGLEDAAPDGEDIEEYTGNDGGDLERWYRRGALVIWHSRHDMELGYTDEDGWKRACDEIAARTAKPKKPSINDRKLLDVVMKNGDRYAKGAHVEVLKLACNAALAWNDPDLWLRAASSNSTSWHHFSDGEKRAGIVKWGFPVVRSYFDSQLKQIGVDKHASFLKGLNAWLDSSKLARKGHTAASVQACRTWIQGQLQIIIDSLDRNQLDTFDCDAFLDTMFDLRGPSGVLQESVLNKIKAIRDPWLLLQLAGAFHAREDIPEDDKLRIVTDLMEAGISRANFHDYQDTQEAEETLASQYIVECCRLRRENLIPSIVDKVADTSDLGDQLESCAVDLLSVLVAAWTKDNVVMEHAAEPLENLRKVTIAHLLDVVAASPEELDAEIMGALLKSTIKRGSAELVYSMVVPRLKAMPVTEAKLRSVGQELEVAELGIDAKELRRILDSMLKRNNKEGARLSNTRPAVEAEPEGAPAAKKRKVAKRK